MATEDQHTSMNDESKPKIDDTGSGSKIRLRALLIGSSLALAICLITPFNNAYRQGTPLGGGHFPLAPFYFFMWLMIFTAVIRALFKGRNLLTGKELLVSWSLIFAMTSSFQEIRLSTLAGEELVSDHVREVASNLAKTASL